MKPDMDPYLEKWRKAAVNRVCKAFQLVEQAEMEKFGLPSTDADEDADPIDDTRAHGFEEPEEEEENADASGDELMEIDADG